MKKIYESPVAEVVNFAALEKMANLNPVALDALDNIPTLNGTINYSKVSKTSLQNF